MGSTVESAPARTLAERTSRFWSVNRRGGPSGPLPRLMRGVVEGIVDFTTGRAITRSINTGGGGVLRRAAAADDGNVAPVYMLFDGTLMTGCVLGRWRDPYPSGAAGTHRGPAGLRFLDLMRPESIIEAIEAGEEEVRGQQTTRYRLKLDVDRIHWPQPDRGAPTPFGRWDAC